MLTQGFMNVSLDAVGVGDGGDESGKVVPFFANLRNERFTVGSTGWQTNFVVMV